MNTIVTAVKAFVDDEDGIAMIEYGLLAALISVLVAGVVTLLNTGLTGVFTDIKDKLIGAIP